jgi:uncharacterized membrane protein
MTVLLEPLTFAAALGSGLVGGIFFAFSTFVMQALRRIPREQGAAAMQAINVTVLNPWFFCAFFGTALVCLAVAFVGWGDVSGPPRDLVLGGCALYLVGTIGVTVAANVPWNDRLAAEGVEVWDRYLNVWTRWNHVRTVASIAASGLFILAQ